MIKAKDNPLRLRITVRIDSTTFNNDDEPPEGEEGIVPSVVSAEPSGDVFLLTFLAPKTEDITRAAAVAATGTSETSLTGHAERFAEARAIMLPLLVDVKKNDSPVPGWEEFIEDSDLLVGALAVRIMQACCFRSARAVAVVSTV